MLKNLFFSLLVGGLVVGFFTSAKAQSFEPSYETIAFDVYRDGELFGNHDITFNKKDDGTVDVDIEIRLLAKLLGFVAYRYEHDNKETWEGNILKRLRSTTNDDGEDHIVDVKIMYDYLDIRGTRFSGNRAIGTFSTSYWNRNTVQETEFINSQDGSIMSVDFRPLPKEKALKAGSHCYQAVGDLELIICYDSQSNKWNALEFNVDGYHIVYKERPEGQPKPVLDYSEPEVDEDGNPIEPEEEGDDNTDGDE